MQLLSKEVRTVTCTITLKVRVIQTAPKRSGWAPRIAKRVVSFAVRFPKQQVTDKIQLLISKQFLFESWHYPNLYRVLYIDSTLKRLVEISFMPDLYTMNNVCVIACLLKVPFGSIMKIILNILKLQVGILLPINFICNTSLIQQTRS